MAILLVFAFATLAIAAPPVFDEPTSLRYVYYSYSAYDTPAPNTWNCRYCVNSTKGFVVTKNCQNDFYGSFAYLGYHPQYQEIVTAFRGSNDLANWLEDADAIKTPPGQAFPGIPAAQVDRGFYEYYESLSSCVLNEIKSLASKYPKYQISITGHSLGAAAASLCSMDMLVNLGYKDLRVLNFGEPRLGNAAFADASFQYMPYLQRMTDFADCVPQLPPQYLGYQHEAYEIFESPEGGNNYKVCNQSGEDQSCNDGQKGDCNCHLHYMGVTLVTEAMLAKNQTRLR